MNRLLLSLTVAMFSITASAQRYVVVNGDTPILASDVEKITYEVDDKFDQILLPGVLALDPKTTIFSQALQLTGLADTLKTYLYAHPDPSDEPKIKYQVASNSRKETAWPFQRKFKNFTVFAETDDAFAEQGITNLEQLKAYAKQVYDEAFPEDAGITDPKDRRNSLNRFVAYHILKHKSTYWYLTVYNDIPYFSFQNTDLVDIAAWYGTLMPHASLKCSYPMAGEESGLYLNHRGLKDGPDKYGKQVRGAKVVADGEQGFDHECYNGCYFYIDSVLTYDQTTRNEVLGSELWRVDFKTLSPDIMSCAKDLRGDYDTNDCWCADQEGPNTGTGCNYYFRWDRMENVVGDTTKASKQLVASRAHAYWGSWQGDAIYIYGDFNMTIKLPALPAGEWEVRMGTTSLATRPNVRIYLNGEMTIDSLDMSKSYDETIPYTMRGPRECFVAGKHSFADISDMVRYRLGRIETDGKSDNYLRIELLPGELGYDYWTQFDYFELVPKAVFDNQEIPEE